MDYSKQIEDALISSSGIKREAARSLGWAWSTFKDRMGKYPELSEKYCSNLIYYPVSHEAEILNNSDSSVSGLSTYYDYTDDETGERKRGWIKTKRSQSIEQSKLYLIEFAKELAKDIKPISLMYAPKDCDHNFVTEYKLFDMHVGSKSDANVSGHDWDLKIAKQEILKAISYQIQETKSSKQALFVLGGDYFDFDSLRPETPRNKHLLDVDTRFTKMYVDGRDIARECIEMIAQKHETVRIVIIPGNHDESLSESLRVLFGALYRDNPRITCPDYMNQHVAFEFGSVMLAYTHGDLIKGGNAAIEWFRVSPEYHSMFGRTKYRYGNSGHEHHYEVMEKHGMIWTKNPTICPSNYYAYSHGFNSVRGMIATDYHIHGGIHKNHFYNPDMLC